MQTGKPFRLQGNVRNDGYITNLPQGCCVEVPVYVDREGLHPLRVGDLPSQCAALNQSNVTVQALSVEAGADGRSRAGRCRRWRWTRSPRPCCTLREIREMTAEMLEAEAKWLPQFAGQDAVRDAGDRVPEERASPWPSRSTPRSPSASAFMTLIQQET